MQIDTGSLMQLDSLRLKSAQEKTASLERKTTGTSILNGEVRRKTGKVDGEDARLRQACSDFQAIFIKQMLDTMRKTVHKDGLLQGGQAEEIFEDMLYDEYAKKMSENAGLGLDDMIYKQLSTRRMNL